ncbi:ParB/RepB/Spo0J family partition protein [Glaciecola sp. 33A]|jgi:ParB family chromosome partitioning protein|uniref:ParB/RepB/Spo0J family partition protein n=1 Tax=Glaciecola sp. 33A TaxID=2057807 RepID=UPI000C33603A|nr:ParB/RepB/Spo0J family partition protein [Glaciecola sp. 33A]PKI01184.1 chromosome partitioning protein ParB [Glaciecola sp. 33A]
MSPKNKGLGRGLDALLATSRSHADKQRQAAENDPGEQNELKHIPIEFMQPGKYQPRKDMSSEALEELAASIRSQGIIQPIVVRQINTNNYEIIAGERRWRAAQLAKLDVIPCLIKDVADDAAVAIALIENIQREDLNAMEEAQALDRLMIEFNLTHQQVADAVGKSRTTVTNLLRLNSLRDDVKRLLEYGDIDMGHARALLALEGDVQSNTAKLVADKGLTVRETENLVKKTQSEIDNPTSEPSSKEPIVDPDVKRLETSLSENFGTHVQIAHNRKGKGKLVINFGDLEQLDGILQKMAVKER